MQYHVRCDEKDISRYVFCPGDYDRAKKIADHFTNPYLVTESRGYKVYSGHYEGVFMTVIGTGMGGPTVAIALEELANMGADTFIRVGSCGVFQPGQEVGDVVIASGTVRQGGTSQAYLPIRFPAVPGWPVLKALAEAAEQAGQKYTVGVGIASDAFYAPQVDPSAWALLTRAGVVFIEMESDTLFVVGALRRWRTGAIYVSDGRPGEVKPVGTEEIKTRGEQDAIRVALRAMRNLARADGLVG
ncbi:MAG: nucleoside phosphorylase [Anaerolineae bacterium]|nr:nucleoside phosphorylase [Anaerolineae bacterium]